MTRRALLAAIVVILGSDLAHAAALDGTQLRWPWALPFIGILLTIATGPLLFSKIWHHHYGKLAFAWGALTLAPMAALHGFPTAIAAFVHALLGEYLSFIVLLFALYVVAGGILVTGNLRGTPLVNAAILAFGTADRKPRRHDRRGDDPDPAADPRQCRTAAQRPCDRVLHHPGRQCRRRALAARRSAAVRRLPARRRFLLDDAASACADRAASRGLCSRASSHSTSGSIARTGWSRRSARAVAAGESPRAAAPSTSR